MTTEVIFVSAEIYLWQTR